MYRPIVKSTVVAIYSPQWDKPGFKNPLVYTLAEFFELGAGMPSWRKKIIRDSLNRYGRYMLETLYGFHFVELVP